MLIINVVLPVFAVIALGYVLARSKQLDIATMSEIAVNVTSPCLVYTSIASRSIAASDWLVMGGAAVAIVLGSGALMCLYQRATGLKSRGLFLPAMFMNSGNMALPFSLLAFGAPGFDKAIIFFIAIAILNYSVGIFIAKGENGLREIFRLPLIYAAILGIASSVTGIKLPEFLMTSVGMLADVAIPLMLLSLGVQLRWLKVSDVHDAIAGVGIRMGGGFLIAVAFVMIFGVATATRKIIFLDSLMPPAVTNVVIAQKYSADPDIVASAIVIGTLLSIVVTPIYLIFAT